MADAHSSRINERDAMTLTLALPRLEVGTEGDKRAALQLDAAVIADEARKRRAQMLLHMLRLKSLEVTVA